MMIDWDAFCDGLDIGSLVPPAYQAYRPALVTAMAFFLDRLPAGRVAEILDGQATLPDDAGIADRLVAIAECCPVLHKLGQVLARDKRLAADLRLKLQRLETMQPLPGAADWVPAALAAEIGPLAAHGIALDPEPLAEASVAMVVPFTWRGDGSDGPTRGVFKLLKPGIEARLAEELEILRDMGGLLDEQCAQLGIPAIRYADTFHEVSDLLQREVCLSGEQAHLAQARAAYAALPAVAIPRLLPFSTPRVTAMTYLDGRKVTAVHDEPDSDRRALARLIVGALIAHPIWSDGAETLFHADPHAGNLLFTPQRGLGLLDWSLAGRLTAHDQICLAQIFLGALTSDAGRILQAVDGLSVQRGDPGALRTIVAARLQALTGNAVPGLDWPGLDWLVSLMDGVVSDTGARFRGDLVIFRKVLHTVQGVASDVAADARPDLALMAAFLTRLGGEWAGRLAALPWSRQFATRFSNAEFAHLMLSAPVIVWRRWLDVAPRLFGKQVSPRR
jgi:ubiquinone biosynthesis protein